MSSNHCKISVFTFFRLFHLIDVFDFVNFFFQFLDGIIKFLEFDVEPGYVLYVPPYWFYSIKYAADDTELYGFYYNSLINCVANIPNWCLYYLQQQNTRYKVLKTRVRFEDEVENVDKEIAKDNTSL